MSDETSSVVDDLGSQLMVAEAEVERLRAALEHARSGLTYVLDHEAVGPGCLCGAGRSVAEASLRLSDPAESEGASE